MADTEYISKEAALACFSDWIDRYGHEHSADEMTEYQRIEELPAADVREVVRKPIVGYEGLYFVTEDGVITNADGKTMKQYTKCGKGTCYYIKDSLRKEMRGEQCSPLQKTEG